jgi:hypothetical protein
METSTDVIVLLTILVSEERIIHKVCEFVDSGRDLCMIKALYLLLSISQPKELHAPGNHQKGS